MERIDTYMKAYVHEKGVILTGKAWEIRYLIRKYQKEYTYVKEWVDASNYSKKKKTHSL